MDSHSRRPSASVSANREADSPDTADLEHSPNVFTPPRSVTFNLGSPPSSAASSSSTRFWRTTPKKPSRWSPVKYLSPSSRPPSLWLGLRLVVFISILSLLFAGALRWQRSVRQFPIHHQTTPRSIRPVTNETSKTGTNPEEWLRRHSNKFVSTTSAVEVHARHEMDNSSRPKAALISLVRNEELDGIVQSMKQLELRWNKKHQYPWIFFNEEPFSKMFKNTTSALTNADCFYEIVPRNHWSIPPWVDESRLMNSLDYLGIIGVGKGWMLSYRNMCRWNSGFFYKHPRLQDYEFYWRVEPDVHFFCDIDYDVFRFMRDNRLKYGFNMNILDDARSFPSLWSHTQSFIDAHPQLIHPDADLDWLFDPETGDYNNCQFFSNFEIGDLRFFRGEQNEAYFDWLDKTGGFYYERFGDAPVHTLSVAMFLKKSEAWYFRDIGYQHDLTRHCPPDSAHRCTCEATTLDENFYKLVPLESPQKKPSDTCIRQFMGGKYLDKKDGWSREGEIAIGGDGYHAYEIVE